MRRRKRLGELPAAPEKCAIRITKMGKDMSKVDAHEYELCLSPAQARALFPTKLPLIGCGSFACAWEAGPRHVLKITSDPDDVAGLMRAQRLPRVVGLRRVLELRNAAKETNTGNAMRVWALVAERLAAPGPALKRWMNDRLAPSLGRDMVLLQAGTHTAAHRPRGAFRLHADARDMLKRPCNADAERMGCRLFMEEFANAFEALFKRGITWRDTHAGNIGTDADGHWKVLDLGVSAVNRGNLTSLPLLGARRLRRPRLRRFT